jgi:SAM-dependent methyltransferase
MLVENLSRFIPPQRHIASGEVRTEAQLREHYQIERELADRLRNAPAERRLTMYAEIYDELLRRVPSHPMLRVRFDPDHLDRRALAVHQQFSFLSGFLSPRSVFMEVGAGDCALSLRAAGFVERVYVVEVSEEIVSGLRAPMNLRLVLSDGVSVPVPEGSVHLAFSDQLMEHLHPEDAMAQLRNIYRALAPGGTYLCVTPNRLYGPRDISGYFDEVATGLHLREYSATEIRRILLAAGFSRVRFYAGARGHFVEVPFALLRAFEALLESLPFGLRKKLADNGPARALLGVRVGATK